MFVAEEVVELFLAFLARSSLLPLASEGPDKLGASLKTVPR